MIVSEPTKTSVYMTLKSPDACCNVKLMLQTLLFEPFGDEVLKRADKSLHPMNLTDKTRIETWQLACDFQTDFFAPEAPEAKDDHGGKRARRKGPARLENLGEWADESQIVSTASSARPLQGELVIMENYVNKAADTVDMLTTQLNDLRLKEERLKRAKMIQRRDPRCRDASTSLKTP